jgi:hypothetical protein
VFVTDKLGGCYWLARYQMANVYQMEQWQLEKLRVSETHHDGVVFVRVAVCVSLWTDKVRC